MKKEVTRDEQGIYFRGYTLSNDYRIITKNGVFVEKSECLRYGDRIAWFIAEVVSIKYRLEA